MISWFLRFLELPLVVKYGKREKPWTITSL